MNVEGKTIYDYSSPRQFLLERIEVLQKKDASLSLRKLSKLMGMRSHAQLTMIVQGKRPLRMKHVPLLAKGFGLNYAEVIYLQALIQYEGARDSDEEIFSRSVLADLNPNTTVHSKVIDEFSLIADWINPTILSLLESDVLNGDEHQLLKTIRFKTSLIEIRSAIERLKSLKLLEKKEGRYVPKYQRLTSADDIVQKGVQKYHKGVSELAKEAVETIDVDEREFQSFCFPMKSQDIPLAKQMIRQFRAKLVKELESKDGDTVYQTNLQYFPLTESPARAEDEGVGTDKSKTL